MNMRSLIRTNRLLAEMGFTNTVEALEELQRLRACRPAATEDVRGMEVSIGHGYKAREDGSIIDPDGKPLLPYFRGGGYLCVSIWRDGVRHEEKVHQVIAKAFCTKHSDLQTQVNHRDGNKSNNAASNIEWCTPEENSIHSARIIFAQDTRPVIGTRLSDGVEFYFPSIAAAVEHGFIRANIQKVIRGDRKKHGGYSWRDAPIDAAMAKGGEACKS